MPDFSLLPLGTMFVFLLALWFSREPEKNRDFGPTAMQRLLWRLHKFGRAAFAASGVGAVLSIAVMRAGQSEWQMVLPMLSLSMSAIASILLCYYTFAQSGTGVWHLQPSKTERVLSRSATVLNALAIPALALAAWLANTNLSLASGLFILGLTGLLLTLVLKLLTLARGRWISFKASKDEDRRKQQTSRQATSPNPPFSWQFRVRRANISARLVGPGEGEIHITLNRSGEAIVGGTDLSAPYHLDFHEGGDFVNTRFLPIYR
jgi:hypothetical protein